MPQVKFVKSGSVVIARVTVEKPICVEQFDVVPQLGRFTLRGRRAHHRYRQGHQAAQDAQGGRRGGGALMRACLWAGIIRWLY